MKVRGSVYNGGAAAGALPGMIGPAVTITGPTGAVIGSATPDAMGEWSISISGNPGTSGDVQVNYIGKSRDLFVGERQLGFGPSWSQHWPAALAPLVPGTTTVRSGVSLEDNRLAVASSGGGLTVTVKSGSVIVPGTTFWVAAFHTDSVLDFSSYNASTQSWEAYGTGEPAGGWVVGVERIPSTEQAFLTMARKESAGSNALSTPNGAYSDPLASYDLNFIPIALVTRSGSLVASVSRVGRYFGEGRFHRRRRDVFTFGTSTGQNIDTTGTAQTFASGSNHTARVEFSGFLKLEQEDTSTWTLQDTYDPDILGEQLVTPNQIAVDSTGRVLVADTSGDRLAILDSDGLYVSGVTADGATGVCVDSSDNIYISLQGSGDLRLRKYNSSLALQWTQTIDAGGAGDQAHVTTNGTHVWVCNTGTRRIYKRLCSTGAAVSNFGGSGVTNGLFGAGGPFGIANDGTHLYVTDPGNLRIQKFLMSTSAYVAQWNIAPGIRGVAIDASGDVLVAETLMGTVYRYTNVGVSIDSFLQTAASGIGVATGDVLWVSNISTGTIAKWDEVSVGYTDWDKLLVLPDVSLNGFWQSLDFGDAVNGALGYGAGWGTDVRPGFIPFRGIASDALIIESTDSVNVRVTVKTSTGSSRISAGQFSFHLVDVGSW
jgi:hypothetical protein